MGLMNISFLMTLFQESLLNALQEILDDLVKIYGRQCRGNFTWQITRRPSRLDTCIQCHSIISLSLGQLQRASIYLQLSIQ